MGIGLLIAGASSAAVTTDASLAFATPSSLQLPGARLQLTPAEADKLADAWLRLLDEPDPRLTAGALTLLTDAPAAVIDSIGRKLSGTDRLARAWARADPEIQGRIRNSTAIRTAKLLDFAAAEFISELDAALATGDVISVASAASTAGGFRHLPAEVVSKIMVALDAGKLEDQQRRELAAVLRNHPEDLKPVQSQLHGWLNNPSSDAVTTQQRDLALMVLLSLRIPLSDKQVVTALKSGDLGTSRAGISYLRAVGADATPLPLLTPAILDEVIRLFRDAAQLGDWSDIYELLRERSPDLLENLYKTTSPADIAKIWPAELTAEWLKRSPAAVWTSLATDFPLDLYAPPAGQLADCNNLRYELALLTLRSSLGQPTLKDFWINSFTRTHNCRERFGDEINTYLEQAGKDKDIGPDLALLANSAGVGQMPDWPLRSTSLSRLLAPELTRRLLESDWSGAKQMLRAGVRPSSTSLEQNGFWTRTKPSPSGLNHEWFFRILQAAGSAPAPIMQFAAQAANDPGLQPAARATALIALASAGRVASHQDIFNTALNDTNELVSRAALVLLGQAYDEGLPKSEFKGPDTDLVENALIRRELADTAANLLPRLTRFGPAYAQLHARHANWSSAPSKNCFSLAPARPLGTAAGVSILNAITTNPSTDVQRACVGLLFDADSPMALVARSWGAASVANPVEVTTALRTLWQSPEFKDAGAPLKKVVGELAAAAGPALPYELESQTALSWWKNALLNDQPQLASQLQSEHRRRMILSVIVGVPAVILLHLSVWAILLAGYPRSATLQAVVFWNPFVRKVTGFGYIDLVLLYTPFARRRLFAPFASEFLRDVLDTRATSSPAQGYFDGSLVRHWPAHAGAAQEFQAQVRPLKSALAIHRGRILLLGKSGLGKSSFLKFWLGKRAAQGKDIMVYLRADQCRSGVEVEIGRRMKGFGADQNLLRSVLYAGRMSVYIDGYNEVDLTTQDSITSFVGDYPRGNILVTSQIPLRGFTGIETFELLPLDRVQVRDFLVTRSEVLPADAVVRDGAFRQAASAFLDDVWAKPATEEELQAFEEVLANPMDLTSVAMLLSQGGVPDLFALEKQQFEVVLQRLRAKELAFRTLGFSRALLTQRLADQEDLGVLPFKPEVSELIHAKLAQVRTFSEPAGKIWAQEIRFRHDRIRDFFNHFVFMEMTPEEQAAHAKDARFAGVFPYLARSMSRKNAEDLREQLITLAAQIEDHRISDSFVREFSWRQRFASQDPDWMLSHDLPAAKVADQEYAELARTRSDLDLSMGRLRDKIASSRRMTRVLTTADSLEVASIAREMLLAIGASEAAIPHPVGATLTDPGGRDFLLVALAQREFIRPFHIDLLVARLEHCEMPKLVILNSQVAIEPEARVANLAPDQHAALYAKCAATMDSVELYSAYRAAWEGNHDKDIWAHLARCWSVAAQSSGPRTEEPA
ncbi:hypothetical protein ABE485_07095 [Achromobacter spanius]|uniref:hypothetical protein n=1 Tax=Achromobacter spanius TaxID=217203 RepID=UPI003208B23D